MKALRFHRSSCSTSLRALSELTNNTGGIVFDYSLYHANFALKRWLISNVVDPIGLRQTNRSDDSWAESSDFSEYSLQAQSRWNLMQSPRTQTRWLNTRFAGENNQRDVPWARTVIRSNWLGDWNIFLVGNCECSITHAYTWMIPFSHHCLRFMRECSRLNMEILGAVNLFGQAFQQMLFVERTGSKREVYEFLQCNDGF